MSASDSELRPISIVTPCRNARDTVGAAIESVLAQRYPRLEHIVMDGASSDGTLEVLARYPHLRVVSEPDQGLYDALNQGIALARGELVGWLNADDMYADGALLAIAEAFRNDPGLEMVCGDAQVIEETGAGWSAVHRHSFTRPEDFRRREIRHGGALLNACLFSRALLERVGPFDASYRISGDKDYLLRLALDGPSSLNLARVTYIYRRHSGSMTLVKREFDTIRLRQSQERLRIYPEYMLRSDVPRAIRTYCLERYREEVFALGRHYVKARAFRAGLGLLRRALSLDRRFVLWATARTASALLAPFPLRTRARAEGTTERNAILGPPR